MKYHAGVTAVCLALTATPVRAADLFVTVADVRSDRGTIMVAICDQSNFPNGACLYHGEQPARAGNVVVRVMNVPPGIWAASVYHDETGKHRREFSLLGLPTQGFGFSRDAKMNFGPPRFSDAAFRLNDADGSVIVPLHYLDE